MFSHDAANLLCSAVREALIFKLYCSFQSKILKELNLDKLRCCCC